MNINDTEKPDLKDLIFHKPDSEEDHLIRAYRKSCGKSRFFLWLFRSAILCICIILIEGVARAYNPNPSVATVKTIPHMIFLVISLFVLFNFIHYIAIKVRLTMNEAANQCECLRGTVTELIDKKQLSKTSHQFVPDFFLFRCEQGACSTAIPIRDNTSFHTVQKDTPVLILKNSPMGVVSYDFLTWIA